MRKDMNLYSGINGRGATVYLDAPAWPAATTRETGARALRWSVGRTIVTRTDMCRRSLHHPDIGACDAAPFSKRLARRSQPCCVITQCAEINLDLVDAREVDKI